MHSSGWITMVEKLPLQEVLDLIPDSSIQGAVRTRKIEVYGELVGITSRRIQTFKQKGTVCVHCGLEATHWEHRADKYDNFKIVLMAGSIEMTQDHIVPKSRGGDNSMDNAQTLCMECNCFKGNKLESEL